MRHTPRSGFIALISAIIITALLLAIVTAASLSGFFGRFNILDSEYKDRSRALAEACVDTALLKLANDPSYGGSETITIGPDSCLIRPVTTSSAQNIIETQSIFQNFYTNLRVTVDAVSLAVVSWEELPNF